HRFRQHRRSSQIRVCWAAYARGVKAMSAPDAAWLRPSPSRGARRQSGRLSGTQRVPGDQDVRYRGLFLKVSRDLDDPERDRGRTQMEPEVAFASLSRTDEFPIQVPNVLFTDYHRASDTGILITKRIALGHNGTENQYAKCMDYQMPVRWGTTVRSSEPSHDWPAPMPPVASDVPSVDIEELSVGERPVLDRQRLPAHRPPRRAHRRTPDPAACNVATRCGDSCANGRSSRRPSGVRCAAPTPRCGTIISASCSHTSSASSAPAADHLWISASSPRTCCSTPR
ncbi:MAG: hypothetical protein QOH82_3873, partial [Mycobacterium sp.]|nr:hypothetical protein [Mycobacterium sp.]